MCQQVWANERASPPPVALEGLLRDPHLLNALLNCFQSKSDTNAMVVEAAAYLLSGFPPRMLIVCQPWQQNSWVLALFVVCLCVRAACMRRTLFLIVFFLLPHGALTLMED